MVLLFALLQATLNLLHRVLSPRLPVELSNVVDDLLQTGNQHLGPLIIKACYVVKGTEDVVLEHVSVLNRDLFSALLLI